MRVFGCIDQNAEAVLIVNDLQCTVCDDDAVGGAEAGLYPAGEVHPLLDENNGISAGLLRRLHLFEYIGGVTIGTVRHFLVEPRQVLGRVSSLHAQRPAELVLTERVGVGALGGIVTAFVVVALAEPSRRRAMQPAVRA